MQLEPSAPDPVVSTARPMIGETFRNGSITAVGVLLAFSLGYLTEWALNDDPWRPADVLAFGPMVVGAALQVRGLALLLQPESLEASRYRRAIAIFLWGLAVLTGGLFIAVFLHALKTT